MFSEIEDIVDTQKYAKSRDSVLRARAPSNSHFLLPQIQLYRTLRSPQ
jgi:hypothetical protein